MPALTRIKGWRSAAPERMYSTWFRSIFGHMTAGSDRSVLLIGGSGVFGSRLAEALVRDGVATVTIAGRSRAALDRVAGRLGCDAVVLDVTGDDLTGRLRELSPWLVIDAAGPFQAYSGDEPYRLARAALSVGAHYFDLSDDAAFTAGIGVLDDAAKEAGLAVISGVSSVPALSSAAVRAMSDDIERIDLIESMILPGNRAPRGRSVMAAILSQAGQPLPGTSEHGWVGSEEVRIETGDGHHLTRLASPIGAPDLVLMLERFGAREVRFRAGLELAIMHRGLELVAGAVRIGLIRSALPLLRVLHPAARLLERLGTDVGAMRVTLRGVTRSGKVVERVWTLTAAAGDGPHVPAIPGRVLVNRLSQGETPPGARACLDDVSLTECERAAPERALTFLRRDRAFQPLFQQILGPAFGDLPAPVRGLHDVAGRRNWTGMAEVTRSEGILAKLVAHLFGFPPAADETPVRVVMVRNAESEVWTRDFGG
ncbi:MAG: DUF4166 domain-containing protein, partial [Silicimonas sp.]|nr:DUF4166 domain-containing protein [Silicimonas sp.]